MSQPETGLELQFFEPDNPLANGHAANLLLLGGVGAQSPGSLPKPDAELSAWFAAHDLRALALLDAGSSPDGETALDWIAGSGGAIVSCAGLEGVLPTKIQTAPGATECIGAGNSEAEVFRPLVRNIDGVRVGFLSCAERRALAFDGHADLLHPMLYDRVRMLQAQCDHVIVFCHAGLPKTNLPLPEWRARYRRLVDAGASVVVGLLPGGVSGWEEYRHGLVFYGLGSLANDRAEGDSLSLGVSLSLERNGRFRYEARLLERAGDTLRRSFNEAEKQAINETNDLFQNEPAYLRRSEALCRQAYDAWEQETCGLHGTGIGRGLLHTLLPQSAQSAKRADAANLLALLENESLRLAVRRALDLRRAEERKGDA